MPSDADIDAASDWLLRLTSGSASQGDMAAFRAWCDADSRHAAAFAEVRQMWNDVEALAPAMTGAAPSRPAASRATGGIADFPRRGPRAVPRFRRLAAGLMAAGLAALAVFAADLPTRLRADYRTVEGERMSVTLPDGSTAHLNTGSAISLAFSEDAREVALLRGEALFEVSRDPARPFRVTALEGAAIALGTVFAVQARDDRALVTVVEGRVGVVSPEPGSGKRAVLIRDQQVSYRAGQAPGPLREVDADKLTAWRRGVLFIEGLPLEAALREIDRYHPGRIFLLAGSEGGEPVSARIALDRIDSGIKALAATHGLSVTHLSDFIVVVR
ncbi:MAG: FecR domain-containing protein [Kiloniellaceae bacterium]